MASIYEQSFTEIAELDSFKLIEALRIKDLPAARRIWDQNPSCFDDFIGENHLLVSYEGLFAGGDDERLFSIRAEFMRYLERFSSRHHLAHSSAALVHALNAQASRPQQDELPYDKAEFIRLKKEIYERAYAAEFADPSPAGNLFRMRFLKGLLRSGSLEEFFEYDRKFGIGLDKIANPKLDPQDPLAEQYNFDFAAMFAGDDENACALLKGLHKAGFLDFRESDREQCERMGMGTANRYFGVSDLIMACLPNCAKAAIELGMKLDKPMQRRRFSNIHDSLCSQFLAGRADEFSWLPEAQRAKHAARAAASLELLRELDPEDFAKPDEFRLANFYCNLTRGQDPACDRFADDLLVELADKCALTNDNLQNRGLAYRQLCMLPWHVRRANAQQAEEYYRNSFDLFERLGIDMKLHSNAAFCAMARVTENAGEVLPALFQFLEAKGLAADPATQDASAEENPVAAAVEIKNLAAAQFFLDKGFSPMLCEKSTGRTLLHMLLQAGTGKDIQNFTRKLIASKPQIKTLLEAGATLGKADKGSTPLMMASAVLSEPMAKILLDAGAEVNAQDKDGNTPLHHSSRKYGAKAQAKAASFVKLLLEAGADPRIANKKNTVPAQAFAKKAPLGALKELLEIDSHCIGGDTAEGKKALAALQKRGSEAVSVAEAAIMSQQLAKPDDGAEPGERLAPKRKRGL